MIKMRKDFTGRKKYIVHKRFTEEKVFFGKSWYQFILSLPEDFTIEMIWYRLINESASSKKVLNSILSILFLNKCLSCKR